MQKRIFEINNEGINEIDFLLFSNIKQKSSSIFLIDIITDDREKVATELKKHNVHSEVCNKILIPSNHLRFEYVENNLYGEIAYFSSKKKKPDLAGIVIHDNLLFLVREIDEGILSGIIKTFSSFSEKQKNNLIDIKYLLFYIIHEILSLHGKLTLSYREEVEILAGKFESNNTKVKTEEILKYKSQLSNLSIVIEKLIYTLSLPPAENVLDIDNPLINLFDKLLHRLEIFKGLLEHTETRLDSLNDHFQLLMQDKMNKRLNFLTIIQSVFAPLTLIAGIYGMNFKYMPELDFKYGYFITVGIMLITAILFVRYFYKHNWFK